MIDLPITSRLNDVQQGLRSGAALVIEAPPGAGKTTLVPLALLHEPWLNNKKILVLEPRRLAAKAAARRMAELLNERLGTTVGYRVRKDTVVTPTTRIEVITEGVLTRMLISDDQLSDVACVIFDEFHERSVHADIGLGLTLLMQELARPDLRIVVMSATLASLDLQSLLPAAAFVRSEGRSFPIRDTWLQSRDDRQLPQLVRAAVSDALREDDGDILVFLPGVGEIRRCEDALRGADADVLALYGELSSTAQDHILRPSLKGARRRVILSTAVAETSITIDGVSTVIDAGLAREPRFDPRSGMTRLVTVPVSQDSAVQRRGRAGRTGPGHCIHLWTEAEHQNLPARRTPEILSADLVPLVLDLAAFGVAPSDVSWLDEPPVASLSQARELLYDLEALTDTNRLTSHGQRISSFSAHPRLAHMQIRAEERGLGSLAARIADLIEESRKRGSSTAELIVEGHDPLDVARCLALAYPDRVAKRKDANRYLLRNGRTARLAEHDMLARHEWLAIADLGGGSEPWIGMAAPLTEGAVRELAGSQIQTVISSGWDAQSEQIVAMSEERLGALTLVRRPATNVNEEALALEFARVLAERDYRDLPWSKATEQLRDRIAFLRCHLGSDSGDTSSDPLSPEALAPFLHGMRKLSDVKRLNMGAVLDSAITWEQRTSMDRLAPATYTTPKGREIRLDYTDPERPMLSVRLQDMFGVMQTPTVANGRIAVTISLLSPANRPIQVTQDLAGFWSGSYAEVRKDMRGRYPKHHWPEEPTQ